MSETKKQRISVRHARNQVNTFGLSLLIYIVLIQVIWHGTAIITRYSPGFFNDADPHLMMMLFTGFMMLFTAFVLFPISARQLKLNIRDYLHTADMDHVQRLSVVAVGVALYVLIGFVGSLFRFLRQDLSYAYDFVGQFTSLPLILNNIAYFILFICIKPVCDEFIFRGIIQRQLGHYGRYFGVAASAVLYAIAQPTLIDAVIALFLGWYLAMISLRYHSIRPSILVHYAVVLFTFIISVIPQRFTWISAILIGLAFLTSGFVLIGRKVSYSLFRFGPTERKLWKIVFTSFTVILCIAVFVAGVLLGLFGI